MVLGKIKQLRYFFSQEMEDNGIFSGLETGCVSPDCETLSGTDDTMLQLPEGR